jgi:hypothetical protein
MQDSLDDRSTSSSIDPAPRKQGQRSADDRVDPRNRAPTSRPLPTATKVEDSIHQAIAFLLARQLPHGEFITQFREGSLEADGGRSTEVLSFDASPFVTALTLGVLSFAFGLDGTLQAGVQKALDRGYAFLQAEMDPGGLWRYWARTNPKRIMIPPDLDDTACLSHALRKAGRSVPHNTWLFRETRTRDGRFLTWLYKADTLRKWWLSRRTHGQAFAHTEAIWQWTGKDDVCAAVNANVILFLGETPDTRQAIEWLVRIIVEGKEAEEVVFYDDPMSLYYFVSRAYFEGVTAFRPIRELLVQRIRFRQLADGSFGNELLTGLALCSLLNLGEDIFGLDGAVNDLLGRQSEEGSWPRIAMYGGPPQPNTFGSAELTTTVCLEGLLRWREQQAAVEADTKACSWPGGDQKKAVELQA